MKVRSEYQCEVCGRVYKSEAAATRCETQPMPVAVAKPGDIVLTGQGFGWFDGDKSWVENYARIGPMNTDARPYGGTGMLRARRKCPSGDTNCFSPCCNYQFYYVVGTVGVEQGELGGYVLDKVDGESVFEHRVEYHLFTRAMAPPGTGYSEGQTYDKGHYNPVVVKSPPILRGAKAFIGKTTGRLL